MFVVDFYVAAPLFWMLPASLLTTIEKENVWEVGVTKTADMALGPEMEVSLTTVQFIDQLGCCIFYITY